MTAQTYEKENIIKYFHISREVYKEPIFIDNQDYQVFVKFLNDYFSDTRQLENSKKTFIIRGRTFQGIPHQPQNFFNQIELLAYKLEPNRFDLLIKQVSPGSMERFSRALSTRYAIYFNKKYHRAGNLFNLAYQSHQVNDVPKLLHLTRELHSNFSQKDGVADHYYSSYPEYLGQRVSKWINPQTVLSLEGVRDYKSFVESGKKDLQTTKPSSLTKPRTPEIILASLILLIFSSFALINIETSSNITNNLLSPLPTPSSQVSGVKTNISSDATPTPTTTRQILDATPSAEISPTSTSSAELEEQDNKAEIREEDDL